MSWGGSQRDIEAALEANGIEKDAEKRADLARSAERIAKGQPPTGKSKKKMSADASLAANRDLNLRLIDLAGGGWSQPLRFVDPGGQRLDAVSNRHDV